MRWHLVHYHSTRALCGVGVAYGSCRPSTSILELALEDVCRNCTAAWRDGKG